jgi:hypothetical protein
MHLLHINANSVATVKITMINTTKLHILATILTMK